MKKLNYISLLFALVTLFLTSCEEKVNDWAVEQEYDKLFRPLVFDLVKANSTSVELKYTKVVSANKYIFEFSKDSLLFNEIVESVVIPADTLTPFAEASSQVKTEYRTIFTELEGTTGYSVRIHALDTITGLKSDYLSLYFKTAAEQIFTQTVSFTNQIQVFWTPTNRLTHIVVSTILKDEVSGENVVGDEVINRALTADEITNANAVLTGLEPGTKYSVEIYNNENRRGYKTIRTFGLADGHVIEVQPSDVLVDLISNAVGSGNTNLILSFTGGETYDISSLTIPSGVSNISFTGSNSESGEKPLLNLSEVRLSDTDFGRLVFENVKINGDYGKYFFFSGTDNMNLEEVSFSSCDFYNARAIIRLGNNISMYGSIRFYDCLIDNIGGYGVVNIGGTNVAVESLSFENSTLTDLATQLMDVRTSVENVFIGNCTFCNLTTAMSQLLRLDTNHLPGEVTTSRNIFAGNNAGAKLNSLSFDMTTTGLNVSFGGSYITNDIVINKYGFADIEYFNGSTYDLFVDPDNHDFTVKSDSGFGGRGTAGDPRWF